MQFVQYHPNAELALIWDILGGFVNGHHLLQHRQQQKYVPSSIDQVSINQVADVYAGQNEAEQNKRLKN